MNKIFKLVGIILVIIELAGVALAIQQSNDNLISQLVVNNKDAYSYLNKPPIIFDMTGNSLHCENNQLSCRLTITNSNGVVVKSYSLYKNRSSQPTWISSADWLTDHAEVTDGSVTALVSVYEFVMYDSADKYYYVYGFANLSGSAPDTPAVLRFYLNNTFEGLYKWTTGYPVLSTNYATPGTVHKFELRNCTSATDVGDVINGCKIPVANLTVNGTGNNMKLNFASLSAEGLYRYIITDSTGRWPDVVWTGADPLNIDNSKPSLNFNSAKNGDTLILSIDARDVGPTRSNIYELVGELDKNPPTVDILKYTGSSKYFFNSSEYQINSDWSCNQNNNNWSCTKNISMWDDPNHFPIGSHVYYARLMDRAMNRNETHIDIDYSFSGQVDGARYIILSDHSKFVPGHINTSLYDFTNGSMQSYGAILIIHSASPESVTVNDISPVTPSDYPANTAYYPDSAYEINVTTDATMMLCYNVSGTSWPDYRLRIYHKNATTGVWEELTTVHENSDPYTVCAEIYPENSVYLLGGKEICSDGTLYGECSSTLPKYCDSGSLVDNCATCGCPSGQSCRTDGTCYTPRTGGGGGGGYTTCTADWSCTDWSECSPAGIQTRTCTDLNNCGTTAGKPEETMTCTYTGTYCGDGICQADESCDLCPEDCGTCPTTPPVCGNGICEAGENTDICCMDCGCATGFNCVDNACVAVTTTTIRTGITGMVTGFVTKLGKGTTAGLILIIAGLALWKKKLIFEKKRPKKKYSFPKKTKKKPKKFRRK
ncbi:MAG: hypothetical protein J7J92_01440 [Candidatus Aenigmarchaeota archaeon]|nr:hypothetical protein [Candidatus Aenigmarchaeota archaeon]